MTTLSDQSDITLWGFWGWALALLIAVAVIVLAGLIRGAGRPRPTPNAAPAPAPFHRAPERAPHRHVAEPALRVHLCAGGCTPRSIVARAGELCTACTFAPAHRAEELTREAAKEAAP